MHAIWCDSEQVWWTHSDGSRILYDSAGEAQSILTGLKLLFPTKSYRLFDESARLACSRCGEEVKESYQAGRCYEEQCEPAEMDSHDEAEPWDVVHGAKAGA